MLGSMHTYACLRCWLEVFCSLFLAFRILCIICNVSDSFMSWMPAHVCVGVCGCVVSDYEALLALDNDMPTNQLRAASQTEVNRLPVVSYRPNPKAVAAGATAGPACCVCLEAFEPGEDLRVLPCFHQFHVGLGHGQLTVVFAVVVVVVVVCGCCCGGRRCGGCCG